MGGKSLLRPVQNNLTGVAGVHCFKACFKVAYVVAVGYDACDVEAALEHSLHLVPGFVHLTAVDTLDGEAVEDDLVPVELCILTEKTELCDAAAVNHVVNHGVETGLCTGHFKTDVKAQIDLSVSSSTSVILDNQLKLDT